MAMCTAPIKGHRSERARRNCPACGGRSNYNYQRFTSSTPRPTNTSTNRSNTNKQKANWSPKNSNVLYTPSEIKTLTPVRKRVEERSKKNDLRDIFLCHAWDDRKKSAKEIYELLKLNNVNVWFSETDVLLGSSLLTEIDKGLAKSRIGIVLVTPAFINRIKGDKGIASKELSALLANDLLVPIVHETTFEALRDVSPLLGSRSGLNTNDDSMKDIAEKLAELVKS